MYLIALLHRSLNKIRLIRNSEQYCLTIANYPIISRDECTGSMLLLSPGNPAKLVSEYQPLCNYETCLIDVHLVSGFAVKRLQIHLYNNGRVSYYVAEPTPDVFRFYVVDKLHGAVIEVFEAMLDRYIALAKPYLIAHISLSPTEPIKELAKSCRDGVCGGVLIGYSVHDRRGSIDLVALPGYDYLFKSILMRLFRQASVIYLVRFGAGSGLISRIALEAYFKRHNIEPALLTDLNNTVLSHPGKNLM